MSLSAYVKEEDAKNMRNLKLFLDRAIVNPKNVIFGPKSATFHPKSVIVHPKNVILAS